MWAPTDWFVGTRAPRLVAVALVFSLSSVAAAGTRHPAAATRTARVAAVAAPARPNVLLVIADDQAWSTFDRANMPNVFAQIADQGVLFDRAYANTSLCCPSRSTMFTGLETTDTGVEMTSAHGHEMTSSTSER